MTEDNESQEEIVEEEPEVDDLEDDEEADEEYEEEDEDESEEELFRQNPLKAIWIKQKDIEKKLGELLGMIEEEDSVEDEDGGE